MKCKPLVVLSVSLLLMACSSSHQLENPNGWFYWSNGETESVRMSDNQTAFIFRNAKTGEYVNYIRNKMIDENGCAAYSNNSVVHLYICNDGNAYLKTNGVASAVGTTTVRLKGNVNEPLHVTERVTPKETALKMYERFVSECISSPALKQAHRLAYYSNMDKGAIDAQKAAFESEDDFIKQCKSDAMLKIQLYQMD
ncbi:hypothetical protein [Vibrio scophthalmi]|uniref:Lipoprotein n=1 Tax=Vibrio scophthalmi LMG 19158 TaxID=870967 RepID=F9RQ14_9VIBR|nr:hypothetical protein [Vibrio scophthalmi]EGU34616.1 hypothetical protein VIS19158_11268 [Vibrio scophthalmi LMG 19158]